MGMAAHQHGHVARMDIGMGVKQHRHLLCKAFGHGLHVQVCRPIRFVIDTHWQGQMQKGHRGSSLSVGIGQWQGVRGAVHRHKFQRLLLGAKRLCQLTKEEIHCIHQTRCGSVIGVERMAGFGVVLQRALAS